MLYAFIPSKLSNEFTLKSYYFYLCYLIFQYSLSNSLSSSSSDSSSSQLTLFLPLSYLSYLMKSYESSSYGNGFYSFYDYCQTISPGFAILFLGIDSYSSIQSISASSKDLLPPFSSYYIIYRPPFFFRFASAYLFSNYALKSFYLNYQTDPCPHCLSFNFKQLGKSLAEQERVGTYPLFTLSLKPQADFHVGR